MARTKYGKVRKISPSWPGRLRDRRPNGFNNSGARCFRNSVIHGLFHTAKLVNALEKGHVRCTYRPSGACLACRLKSLCKLYWAGSSPAQNVIVNRAMHDLHRLLIGMWPTELNHTNLNEQSDSHDFYLGLVDIFHSQLARNGFPLFRSILATKVRHTITCPDCHHTTSNSSYEPSLEINLPSGRNAERRLAALIYPAETLDDYRCQGPVCIQPAGRVRKTEHIVNAPDILTVHIRRFVYNRQTGAQSKDSSWVNIPVHLDLTDHYDGQAKERLMYRLIGSVLHRGSPHGGHYICVAEGPNGNWHELEDHRVRDASIDGIIARPRFGFTPYMLFYERQL